MALLLRNFNLLLISSLLLLVACEKDDDDQHSTLNDKIIGTWQLTEDGYAGITEYSSDGTGTDAFIHIEQIKIGEHVNYNLLVGSAEFTWDFDNDFLNIHYTRLSGDYQRYNGITVGTSMTTSTDISDSNLTMDYLDETIIYTKIPGNSVNTEDLKKTWQITDGDYTGFVTLAYNGFWDSFIAGDQYGMARCSWIHVGNAIIIGYNEELFGNYEEYNQISQGAIMVLPISVVDNSLTIQYGQEEFVYSLFEEAIDITDSWQYIDGSYAGILTFDGFDGFFEAFIDGNESGLSYGTYLVNGNILTMRYGGLFGDFESYNDIHYNTTYAMFINPTGNKLMLDLHNTEYEYTFFESSINIDDLQGSWKIIIGDYSAVMTFDGHSVTDTFSDGEQSGSANFLCFISGNIISLSCNSFEGDYESYNEISPGESIINTISLNNNELTFHFEDGDYTYTFISK